VVGKVVELFAADNTAMKIVVHIAVKESSNSIRSEMIDQPQSQSNQGIKVSYITIVGS
jgi:hypothetical protein